MRNSTLFVIICTSFLNCGDYAAIEQVEANKKKADSIFHAHIDSLGDLLEEHCDSIYKKQYDLAIDSIRDEQLEKIIELTQ